MADAYRTTPAVAATHRHASGGDDDDQSPIDCRCFWLRRYRSTAHTVDWRTTRIERGMFSYEDPALDREFHRFQHREFVSVALLAVQAVALRVFAASDGLAGHGAISGIASFCTAVVVGLAVAEIVLATAFRVTAPVSFARGVVRGVAAAATCLLAGMLPRIVATNCQISALWTGPADDATKDQYCYGIVDVALPLVAVLQLPMLRIHMGFSLLAFVCASTGFIVARTTTAVTYVDNAAQTAIQLGAYVVLGVGGQVLCYQGFEEVRAQFEVSLKVTKERHDLVRQRNAIDTGLAHALPAETLELALLPSTETYPTDYAVSATTLYSTIAGFGSWIKVRDPREVFAAVNAFVADFDRATVKLGAEKLKSVGDSYWLVCGLPAHDPLHADKALSVASRLHHIVDHHNKKHPNWHCLQLCVGVHSGVCGGALINASRLCYDLFGSTGEVAMLVAGRAPAGRTALSDDTRRLSTHPITEELAQTIEHDDQCLTLYLAPPDLNDDSSAPGDVAVDGDDKASVHSERSSVVDIRIGHERFGMELTEQRRRRLWLSHRAVLHANMETITDDDTLLDDLDEMSRRKSNWCFFEFSDIVLELAYDDYVREHAMQRRTGKLLLAVLGLWMWLSIFFDASGDRGIAPIPMVIVAWLGIVASLAADVAFGPNATAVLVHTIVVHLAAMLFLIAAGLMPDEVAGNSTGYWVVAVGAFVTIPSPFPPHALFAVYCVFAVVHIVVDAHVWLAADVLFMLVALAVVGFALVLQHKFSRARFVEREAMSRLAAVRTAQTAVAHELYGSMVPPCFADDVMRWDALDGRAPERCVVHQHDSIAVAMIHFEIDRSFDTDQERMGAMVQLHRDVDDMIASMRAVYKIKSLGNRMLLAGPLDGSPLADAIVELVGVAAGIRRIAPSSTAGMASGPAVGAVVGRFRMSYELIGLAVNIVSVLVDNVPPGVVAVTEGFGAKLSRCKTRKEKALSRVSSSAALSRVASAANLQRSESTANMFASPEGSPATRYFSDGTNVLPHIDAAFDATLTDVIALTYTKPDGASDTMNTRRVLFGETDWQSCNSFEDAYGEPLQRRNTRTSSSPALWGDDDHDAHDDEPTAFHYSPDEDSSPPTGV